MNIELINPFSIEDMKRVEIYDDKNQSNLKKTIESQYSSMNEETYKKSLQESYIIALYLYIKKQNEIEEICYANIERDINKATLIPLSAITKSSKIIKKTVNFIFETTQTTDMAVIISKDNQAAKCELERNGFISLGNEENQVIYYKEKEPTYDISMEICQRS